MTDTFKVTSGTTRTADASYMLSEAETLEGFEVTLEAIETEVGSLSADVSAGALAIGEAAAEVDVSYLASEL